MRVSTKLRYSSRLLVALARAREVINTTELGKELDVSPLYLRSLAVSLEEKGLVKSIRGAKGGYFLAKPPSEISLLDIAETLENLNLVPCLEDPSVCPFAPTCKTRKVWLKLKNCIEKFLRETTLEDLLED